MNLETALVPLLVSALFTYTAAPPLIKWLLRAQITGVDVHKPEKPVRAEMGGIISLIAISLASITLALFQTDPQVLSALAALILVGLVGMTDDLVGMRQRYKPFLLAAASIPLVLSLANRGSLWIPAAGTLEFGYIYPLVLVPLGIATASNLTNMSAGFNGLEVGTGTVAVFSLTMLSAYKGHWQAALVGGILLATFVPFLRYNMYPAKMFPGDTGTLLVGAAIATISIMSSLEVVGMICLMPAAIDFTLKMTSRRPFQQRSAFGDTKVSDDGTLQPPPYPALAHAFMRFSSMKEPDLVLSMLFMQAAYSTLGAVIAVTFV